MSNAPETLTIRHMVCDRCKWAVEAALAAAGWTDIRAELGLATGNPPAAADRDDTALTAELRRLGFELVDGRDVGVRLRALIIDYVYQRGGDPDVTLRDYLSLAFELSYDSLSRKFHANEGRPLEQFYQSHRMERARRLLGNTKLPVSEIADRLRYGTLSHFSNAFRRAEGVSPTTFRRRGAYAGLDLVSI